MWKIKPKKFFENKIFMVNNGEKNWDKISVTGIQMLQVYQIIVFF